MDKKAFFYFGQIIKKFGYKGELVFSVDVDDPSIFHDLKFVFIEINQRLIPFFIEHIRERTEDTILVKLEDISTPEKALELIGSALFLPSELLPEIKDDAIYFHEIIGFDVIDEKEGNLGKISNVIEHPQQSLILIIKEGKEILIPLANELIIKIDKKKKQLLIDAPEGLISLNK